MAPIMTAAVVFLISIRFLMVFFPQNGYIHPDEFFQSVEITAGDILKIDVHRSWEFNSTTPIRCISFPYIISGLPILLLKCFQQISTCVISPYWLLVLPRLWMTLLSLTTDYSIHVMCTTFDINSNLALKIYASSYVALVYMTRTFSNSLETILTALFISVVLKTTTMWKIKRLQRSTWMYLEIEPMSIFIAFLLGVIIAMAIFNRPTFLVFILAPVSLWTFLFIKKSTVSHVSIYLIEIAVFASFGVVVGFVIFVSIDTLYFYREKMGNFGQTVNSCFDKDLSNSIKCFKDAVLTTFIVSPWNFIRYNTKNENLSEHGIHPRFLHILVNLPLLLGPLVAYIFLTLTKMVIPAIKSTLITNFKILYLAIVFLCPVLCLSIFPHQEPRFLLPVVPVACVLAAEILSTQDRKLFWISWISFTFVTTIFYGFLHQGGVVSSLIENHSNWSANTNQSENYLIFYKTYMPPRHLLISNSLNLIDLQGGPIENMFNVLSDTKRLAGNNTQITIISPATVLSEVKKGIPQIFQMDSICPHISMEDPPDISNMLKTFDLFDQHLSDFCINIISFRIS